MAEKVTFWRAATFWPRAISGALVAGIGSRMGESKNRAVSWVGRGIEIIGFEQVGRAAFGKDHHATQAAISRR